jgi:hypothetical protein
MGFHLLIFWTLLSLAMLSTWPNQFNDFEIRIHECNKTVNVCIM